VLYEWLRGPRQRAELADQEALFPAETALSFGAAEATRAAKLYRTVKSPRGREMDLAIAAYALARDAELWTLNRSDFQDVPGLRLASF
jgi:predicted nucleic acid-binding protein